MTHQEIEKAQQLTLADFKGLRELNKKISIASAMCIGDNEYIESELRELYKDIRSASNSMLGILDTNYTFYNVADTGYISILHHLREKVELMFHLAENIHVDGHLEEIQVKSKCISELLDDIKKASTKRWEKERIQSMSYPELNQELSIDKKDYEELASLTNQILDILEDYAYKRDTKYKECQQTSIRDEVKSRFNDFKYSLVNLGTYANK